MVYSQVGNKGRSNSEWQIVSPVGSGDSFKFGTFFVFRKNLSSSTIRDKRELEEGRIFQVWNFFIFLPLGIRLGKS